uniref:LYR motif-containing protein 2 n=1 Tax=Poecilia mexicana TaxID=48701 RepID=A0A3B3WF37_9TELE
MGSRLPPAALSLKQFLQRQKVLGVYRSMLRTIRQVPDEADRKYLRDWAREEFKRNKNATNQSLLQSPVLHPLQTLALLCRNSFHRHLIQSSDLRTSTRSSILIPTTALPRPVPLLWVCSQKRL